MSSKVTGWAYEQTAGSPLRKSVLVKLADQANDEGEAYIYKREIAAHVEASPRGVQQALQALESDHLLTIVATARRDGGQDANLYRLHVPWRNEKPGGGARKRDPQEPSGGGVENRVPTKKEEPGSSNEEHKNNSSRRSQIPKDWQPSEDLLEWAIKTLAPTSLAATEEVDRFRDYWIAQGKPMKDWNAAFRNWIRNAIEWRGAKQAPESGEMKTPEEEGYVRL